ncbi:MAG: hypothetical protein ACOY4O_16745 [Pseudomonadota bacterium]
MKRNKENRRYNVFTVDGEGDNAFWSKVGVAFEHEDRAGFNLVLTALPVDGRLVVREPKPQEAR